MEMEDLTEGLTNASSKKRRRGGVLKLKAQQRTLAKMKTLQYYKGKKVPAKDLICSVTNQIFFLADGKLESWGLTYSQEGLRLCASKGGIIEIISDHVIVGCIFEKTIDLKDCQETLVLLFQEDGGEEKTCICLSRADYSCLNQDEVDHFVLEDEKISLERSTWENYPVRNVGSAEDGIQIANYIVDILQWSRKPYVDSFKVGKKTQIQSLQKPFHAKTIPKFITEHNFGELFDDLLGAFKNEKLFDGQALTVPTTRCHLAPQMMKYRDWNPDYTNELKLSFLAHSALHFQKRLCFLIPIRWDENNGDLEYEGTALERKPSASDIDNCHFWIIGGQHTIMAYKLLCQDVSVDDNLKKECDNIKAVMFWAPFTISGHLKMMNLSQTLNTINDVKMEASQFLLVARQVRNIWKAWGSPSEKSANSKDSTWKEFNEAAKLVIPWNTGAENKPVKFREMSPFIFLIKDETFELWMKVYEKSRTGSLIAYNACSQSEVVKKKKRTSWDLTRRQCRNMQGCEDDVIKKIATYLLTSKKISLDKDRPKEKRTFKKEEAGKWTTLEQYCLKKKKKKAFEILLLKHFHGDKVKQSRHLKKEARKERMEELKKKYHIDKGKIQDLRRSLGEKVLVAATSRNFNVSKMLKLIPDSFKSLVKAMKSSIDIDGNLQVQRLDDRLQLRSLNEIDLIDFHENLRADVEFRKKTNFIFFDATTMQGRSFDCEFFRRLFQSTCQLGLETSHVVVLILDPIQSFIAGQAIVEIPGYYAFTGHYVKKKSDSLPIPSLFQSDDKVTYMVTYAFYRESFKQWTNGDVIIEAILKSFKQPGTLLNYEETTEDELEIMIAQEKSKNFFLYICKLFLEFGNTAVCFGDGTNLIKCLLEIGVRVRSYCSEKTHEDIRLLLSPLFPVAAEDAAQALQLDIDRLSLEKLLKKWAARKIKRKDVKEDVIQHCQDVLSLDEYHTQILLDEYDLSGKVDDEADSLPYVLPTTMPCGPIKGKDCSTTNEDSDEPDDEDEENKDDRENSSSDNRSESEDEAMEEL